MVGKSNRLGLAFGVSLALALLGGVTALAEDAVPADPAAATAAAPDAPAVEVAPAAPSAAEPTASATEQPVAPAPTGSDPTVAAPEVAAAVGESGASGLALRIEGCRLILSGIFDGGHQYEVEILQGEQVLDFVAIDAATTGRQEKTLSIWVLAADPLPSSVTLAVYGMSAEYSQEVSVSTGMTIAQLAARLHTCAPGYGEPALVAVPAKVQRGQEISFQARGFFFDYPVSFYFDGTYVGTAEADDYTEAVLDWTIPADFALGKHEVTAVAGENPAEEEPPAVSAMRASSVSVSLVPDYLLEASATFEVIALPATPPKTLPTTLPTTSRPTTTMVQKAALATTGLSTGMLFAAGLLAVSFGAFIRIRRFQ